MQLGKKIKENCLLLVLLTVHKHADRSDQIIDIYIPFCKHTQAIFNRLGTEGIIFNLCIFEFFLVRCSQRRRGGRGVMGPAQT